MSINSDVEILARTGKKGLNVVSLIDLMNLTGKNYGAAKVSALRLAKKEILKPVPGKKGLWFNTMGNQQPESVIPRIEPDAYLTAETALSRYGLITFIPNVIVAGTPNKSRKIYTPYGTIQLLHIPSKYYTEIYEDRVTGLKTATREKAIVDLFYLKRDQGLSLGSVNIIEQIDKQKLFYLASTLPFRQKRKFQKYIKFVNGIYRTKG